MCRYDGKSALCVSVPLCLKLADPTAVFRVNFVHSGGGLIFWREWDALPVAAPQKKDDAEKDDAIELAELIRERPVKATEAREMAQKLFNSKARGESLTGNNNSRYYGTEEALENLRKTVFLHP